MSEFDFSGVAQETVETEHETLKKITEYSLEQLRLDSEIREQEEKLKKIKQERDEISQIKIPNLLENAGISRLRLANGKEITVEDKLKASIRKDLINRAYASMVKLEMEENEKEEAEQNIASLFKSEIVLPGDTPTEILNVLVKEGVEYDEKLSIHHQTLGKYCRQQIEKGKKIPEEITVFEYKETKIK